jgi:drug/metabolite transporter (DMT)-like permease
MHLTVFVWGFTAILGKLISISAVPLVWYRVLVVIVVMPVVIAARKLPFRIAPALARQFALVGVLVAAHWLLFYGCIKYAGVAVAVLCLSTTTFFTAVLEPFVFKRRANASPPSSIRSKRSISPRASKHRWSCYTSAAWI